MSSRKSLGAGGRVAGLMRPPPVAPAMTFPILTAEELVVSLSEMGIAIVEDDIIKCRQDVLKNVFDQLIMTVLNVTSDELYQAKFAGLAAVEENSELHEESVHIVHWLRAMSVRPRAAPVQPRHGVAVHRGCALHSCRAVPPSPPPFPAPTFHHPLPLPPHRNKLLAAAGMPEGYALKDLVKPDRAKVAKALSGIINLQKFRESVQDEYDAFVQKTVRQRLRDSSPPRPPPHCECEPPQFLTTPRPLPTSCAVPVGSPGAVRSAR